jgi:hypothetical protein
MVAATLGLGGVERGVKPNGDQGILKRRPGASMGVDVAGGHAGHAKPMGESLESPVARAVAGQERALKLDP